MTVYQPVIFRRQSCVYSSKLLAVTVCKFVLNCMLFNYINKLLLLFLSVAFMSLNYKYYIFYDTTKQA